MHPLAAIDACALLALADWRTDTKQAARSGGPLIIRKKP